MRRNFVYRLYPTKTQATALHRTLDECRWLYNHLLEKRKTAWKERHESPSLYEQQKTLPPLKAERASLGTVNAQVLQNVVVRLDLTMRAFFRRVKAAETPGYPRFRGEHRYDSFTYPQAPSGCKLVGKALHLSKIGTVRVVLHRPLEGTPKTCTIRRSSTGKWYAIFSCAMPKPVPLPASPERVGIDVGLTTFATMSSSETVANPRFFRTDEAALTKVQRRFSKEEQGTPGRRNDASPWRGCMSGSPSAVTTLAVEQSRKGRSDVSAIGDWRDWLRDDRAERASPSDCPAARTRAARRRRRCAR